MPEESIHSSGPAQALRGLARLGGSATAGELRAALGVSQPTLSRWLQEGGSAVVRMGRARSTRYGRVRELPGLATEGGHPVWRVDPSGKAEPFGELFPLWGGGHWLAHPARAGEGVLFEGLPPFVADMAPQGFLGRSFTARHLDLSLPDRLTDWSGDHMLVAILRRGEDCVGDLICGRESMDRWLAQVPEEVTPTDYPALAQRSAAGEAGSSAGGEQPKFLALREETHVLVKFVGPDSGEASQRWRDLLACEALALAHLRQAGVAAAQAQLIDEGGYRFLEVERFDRVGSRGRRGVLSLGAADDEFAGVGGTWSTVARALRARNLLTDEDAHTARWLDVFGQLSGNTDRHRGNLAFYTAHDGQLALAPVYDMLPMAFAPAGTSVVERSWSPQPPTVDSMEVWRSAADEALGFWEHVIAAPEVSAAFKVIASRCRQQLSELAERVPA